MDRGASNWTETLLCGRTFGQSQRCTRNAAPLGSGMDSQFVSAGGPAWTERLPIRFTWLSAAA
jgi:hypothetical protein